MAFEEPAGDEQGTGKFADGAVEAQRVAHAFVARTTAAPQIPGYTVRLAVTLSVR